MTARWWDCGATSPEGWPAVLRQLGADDAPWSDPLRPGGRGAPDLFQWEAAAEDYAAARKRLASTGAGGPDPAGEVLGARVGFALWVARREAAERTHLGRPR